LAALVSTGGGLLLWILPPLITGRHLIGPNALGLLILPFPLALAVAILRHHLFDIDFVINRALVYGTLTASTMGLYVFIVGYLGNMVQDRDRTVIAFLATGLVAVLFQPLRQRLQRGVNRLIYGERDDPYGLLSRLGQRLETTLAPATGLRTIVETVAVALKLPHVAISLREGDTFEIAASFGLPGSDPLILPLIYQGEAIGQLICGPRVPDEVFTESEQRLLRNVARQAGAVANAVRLTADLQRSRERLVTAREEERRRLRRDLHDGLGPTLAALHVQANAVRRILHGDPQTAETMLAEFQSEIREAIDDIRRVVYELRPPRLDELGLVGATQAYAAQCSLEASQQHDQAPAQSGDQGLLVRVEAPSDLPPLPAAVEVAAYNVAREALTNVVRHARAQTCLVSFQVADALILRIVDDGVGLPAENKSGVGLLSMRERVEELGGTFAIEPAAGGGARVIAQFPMPEVLPDGSITRVDR
jgi:signal transduction histidine kinase